MTDNRPDAPSLAPRIRPARDENIDPIDPTPAVARPAELVDEVQTAGEPVVQPVAARPDPVPVAATVRTAPPARRMRAEVTVQLTSRVSERTRDLVDDIVARDGGTVRGAIERAIAAYASAIE